MSYMNDLIKFENNKPIISDEFKENYKRFVILKEEIEEAQKTIKDQMVAYFESLPEEDRKPLNFDYFKISYVKPSIRKTFDSKRFQDEHPKEYSKYLKESEVSATIKYI